MITIREENLTATVAQSPPLNPPKSKWQCFLFGSGKNGISLRPLEGQEPNWFHRKMQYLILGNEWVKDK